MHESVKLSLTVRIVDCDGALVFTADAPYQSGVNCWQWAMAFVSSDGLAPERYSVHVDRIITSPFTAPMAVVSFTLFRLF